MSQKLPFWKVDAFTNKPFKGNPAAIFILDNPISDQLMLDISLEMNLSETAFILLNSSNPPLLRWFTPTKEIDLCGHATLAAAHVYLYELYPSLNSIIFDTKFVGPLKIEKNNRYYTMNFPSRPGNKLDLEDIPQFVLDAISINKPIDAYISRDLMLIYENEQVIYDINPDFNALSKYENYIIVTAKSNDPKYDFISRFFCSKDGVFEDPVTGSAHCTSTPYWSKTLGKTKLSAYQASKRGGDLFLEMANNNVMISGYAVTIAKGDMRF